MAESSIWGRVYVPLELMPHASLLCPAEIAVACIATLRRSRTRCV